MSAPVVNLSGIGQQIAAESIPKNWPQIAREMSSIEEAKQDAESKLNQCQQELQDIKSFVAKDFDSFRKISQLTKEIEGYEGQIAAIQGSFSELIPISVRKQMLEENKYIRLYDHYGALDIFYNVDIYKCTINRVPNSH